MTIKEIFNYFLKLFDKTIKKTKYEKIKKFIIKNYFLIKGMDIVIIKVNEKEITDFDKFNKKIKKLKYLWYNKIENDKL